MSFNSGQRCLPADWGTKSERVKPSEGTNADTVNPILDRYTEAAEHVHQVAQRAGRSPEPAEMRAAIEARYAQLLAKATGLPRPRWSHLPHRA